MRLIEIFPEYSWYCVTYGSYYETHAVEFAINEGIYKTCPQQDLIDLIRTKLNANVFTSPDAPDDVIGEFGWPYSFNKIEQFITSRGWFISVALLNNKRIDIDKLKDKTFDTHDVCRLILEPIHSDFVETPDILYHATPLANWKKIQKLGLSPKSKSVVTFHPERIYFVDNLPRMLDITGRLASAKFHNAKATSHFDPKEYYSEWAILKIDTTKIPSIRNHSYFRVHKDTKSFTLNDEVLYSQNYVPPNAISLCKTVDIEFQESYDMDRN
jgi:hypothetical protein